MSIETDTRDRVIRIESKFETMEARVDSMDEKLTQIHEAFIEGRGGMKTAKFGFRLIWIGIGGVLSAVGFKLSDLLSSLPPR